MAIRTKPALVWMMVGSMLGSWTNARSGPAEPRMTGTDGYLTAWDIRSLENADIVCSEPYVWIRTREIECDEGGRDLALVGADGYLLGYSVLGGDGNLLCSDPWIWTATQEIECS